MFGERKTAFSATTAETGNAPKTSIFGQPAFKKPNTTGFGPIATQATPSLFGQQATPSTGFGPFGQTAVTAPDVFGATTTDTGNATTTSTGFGPTAMQTTPSLFGQQATPLTSFGAFGQTAVTAPNVFGATQISPFGQPGNAASKLGTSIAKYQATMDTYIDDQSNNINTKSQHITRMKEYEGKSLEELRMEDYLANRKGPQPGTSRATGSDSSAGICLFGSTPHPPTGFVGQTTAKAKETKSLFGFGQPASAGFRVIANQQQNSFLAITAGLGSTGTDANNSFAAITAAPALFSQTTAACAVPAVPGVTGNMQQQQPSLFGQTDADANEPTFALCTSTAANRGFRNFGNTAANTFGGRLFGAKPGTNMGFQTD
uniref:Nuclear pore complex protein Nup98-Nup96 n=1 Tax=Glossina pallidipes TaxID=7398 RepID=A0A1A9ZTH7_GLOPL